MEYLTYFFIATVVMAVIGIALCFMSAEDQIPAGFIVPGIIFIFISALMLLMFLVNGWSYISAKTRANILNKQFNTHYTREEIFFAGDLIEEIKEMERKRVEVNGDLFREKSDKN